MYLTKKWNKMYACSIEIICEGNVYSKQEKELLGFYSLVGARTFVQKEFDI
jgi:hypothetical protein